MKNGKVVEQIKVNPGGFKPLSDNSKDRVHEEPPKFEAEEEVVNTRVIPAQPFENIGKRSTTEGHLFSESVEKERTDKKALEGFSDAIFLRALKEVLVASPEIQENEGLKEELKQAIEEATKMKKEVKALESPEEHLNEPKEEKKDKLQELVDYIDSVVRSEATQGVEESPVFEGIQATDELQGIIETAKLVIDEPQEIKVEPVKLGLNTNTRTLEEESDLLIRLAEDISSDEKTPDQILQEIQSRLMANEFFNGLQPKTAGELIDFPQAPQVEVTPVIEEIDKLEEDQPAQDDQLGQLIDDLCREEEDPTMDDDADDINILDYLFKSRRKDQQEEQQQEQSRRYVSFEEEEIRQEQEAGEEKVDNLGDRASLYDADGIRKKGLGGLGVKRTLAGIMAAAAILGVGSSVVLRRNDSNSNSKSSSSTSSSVSSEALPSIIRELIEKEFSKISSFEGQEYFSVENYGLIEGLTELQSRHVYQNMNALMMYYNYLYDGNMKQDACFVDNIFDINQTTTGFSFFVDGEEHYREITKNGVASAFRISLDENGNLLMNGTPMTDENIMKLCNDEIVYLFDLPRILDYVIYATQERVPYLDSDKTVEDIFTSWYMSQLDEQLAQQKIQQLIQERENYKNVPEEFRRQFGKVVTQIKFEMGADSYNIFYSIMNELTVSRNTNNAYATYNYVTRTIDLGTAEITDPSFVIAMREAFTLSSQDYLNRPKINAMVREFTRNQMGEGTFMGTLIQKYGKTTVNNYLADYGYIGLFNRLSEEKAAMFYETVQKLSNPNTTPEEKEDIIEELQEELGLKEKAPKPSSKDDSKDESTSKPKPPTSSSGSSSVPNPPESSSGSSSVPNPPESSSGSSSVPNPPESSSGSSIDPLPPESSGGSSTDPNPPESSSGSSTDPVEPPKIEDTNPPSQGDEIDNPLAPSSDENKNEPPSIEGAEPPRIEEAEPPRIEETQTSLKEQSKSLALKLSLKLRA